MPLPQIGVLLGETGSGKIIFRSRVQLACTTCAFLLDHRTSCTLLNTFFIAFRLKKGGFDF